MRTWKWIISVFVLALTAGGVSQAGGGAPALVNYQGLLTDADGVAIPDGGVDLEFNLYDAALGGNRVWGPQQFNGVPVVGGRFNVILGPEDGAERSLADAFGATERYLAFKAGTEGQDLSGVEEISPRQRILAAPFALSALHGVPLGSIMAYFGTLAPEGWLLCDGRALDDAALADGKYAALKAHLGALGMTTLPDLRGRVIAGPDDMGAGPANRILKADGRTLGQSGGEERHVLTAAEMPNHAHYYGDIYYSENIGTVGVPGAIGSGKSDRDNKGLEIGRATATNGGNASHNNMPPYLIVTHIIKY